MELFEVIKEERGNAFGRHFADQIIPVESLALFRDQMINVRVLFWICQIVEHSHDKMIFCPCFHLASQMFFILNFHYFVLLYVSLEMK